MGLFDAKTSAKGQVTVPVEVRRLIGLEAGGKVQFKTDADGRVYVTAKKRSIKALKGLFPRPPSPIDVDAAISSEVMRRNKAGSAI
ncbi:MAG: AbrB/MazE/SpoVT family DNA-binding domain-containing protein [Rhizobiaceae bacterium]